MTDCICGKRVSLHAYRLTANRRRGVAHFIAHFDDGTPACGGPWECLALKPYPRDESQREYRKLLNRWEAFAARSPANAEHSS